MEIDKMKEVLSNFEERMTKLENPVGPKADGDPAKQSEDEFIRLMKDINTGSQTDQAGDASTDEELFIRDLQSMNDQSSKGDQ